MAAGTSKRSCDFFPIQCLKVMAHDMMPGNNECKQCSGNGINQDLPTAFNAYLSSPCPKGVLQIHGCKWFWSNAVMVVNPGKSIASYTAYQPEILVHGFQTWINQRAGRHSAPNFANDGISYGRSIDYLGQNDSAWNKDLVRSVGCVWAMRSIHRVVSSGGLGLRSGSVLLETS